jgi:hypothetical protein
MISVDDVMVVVVVRERSSIIHEVAVVTLTNQTMRPWIFV